MRIDWAALGIVAAVSLAMTLAFILLLASGIRVLSAAPARGGTDGNRGAVRTAGRRPIGFVLLGLAGLLVVLGIYLILPISG